LKEVELSTMVPMNALGLEAYEKETFTHVRHLLFGWATGWNNVLQIGLYQKGPDLSEVGSTWIENLVGMSALRPFNSADLLALGGEKAFFSTTWPDKEHTDGRIWSIPWLLDTRVIHYRRDLLKQARIDPATAFTTPEALYDTLARLQAAGIPYPLAVPTGGLTLHGAASFVWGRGGSFRSEDYKRITLVEPEARQGLYDYFRLHRFIHPSGRGLDYAGADDLYFHHGAAVLLSGQWVLQTLQTNPAIPKEVVRNNACVKIPGVPYVGGTHLVIWRHSLHDDAAMQLIAYLTSPPVLEQVYRVAGNFPARIEALNAKTFSADPCLEVIGQSIRSGKTLRAGRLWAGIEMRLSGVFEGLWTDLLENPELDLKDQIEQRVRQLATRLEKTLLAN